MMRCVPLYRQEADMCWMDETEHRWSHVYARAWQELRPVLRALPLLAALMIYAALLDIIDPIDESGG